MVGGCILDSSNGQPTAQKEEQVMEDSAGDYKEWETREASFEGTHTSYSWQSFKAKVVKETEHFITLQRDDGHIRRRKRSNVRLAFDINICCFCLNPAELVHLRCYYCGEADV